MTGNAFNPEYPDDTSRTHLHYSVKKGDRWAPNSSYVDPADFLYAEFDEYGKNINDCNE